MTIRSFKTKPFFFIYLTIKKKKKKGEKAQEQLVYLFYDFHN